MKFELFRTGSPQSLGAAGTTIVVDLPFAFPFYCSDYDSANVSIDGFVAFGTRNRSY